MTSTATLMQMSLTNSFGIQLSNADTSQVGFLFHNSQSQISTTVTYLQSNFKALIISTGKLTQEH